MAPYCLFGYELLTESVDILLIFALLVGIADGRERGTVVVQAHQTVGRCRSSRWHDQWLRPRRKLVASGIFLVNTFILRGIWSIS